MICVKICGVTTPADAAFATECGADAIGLNFYPKSPRFVTERQATAIVRVLPTTVVAVGVFVDTRPKAMTQLITDLRLRAGQSYDEPVPQTETVDYIAAFRVQDELTLAGIKEFVETAGGHPSPNSVLLDSYVPGEIGGTGHRAPWHLLAGFDPGVPVILAGGLTPDNVADAIRTVRPAGVDVASGVESAPGVKDPGKVRAFIQAAREAAAALPTPPPVFRLRAGPGHLE